MHFEAADAGIAPTQWQASTFPEGFRDKITVIHDGIDTNRLVPNPGAGLTLNNSIPVTRQDQIITFVNRNLEPYRGYHIFMRALPEQLMQLSTVHVYLTYPFVLSWSLLEAMSMGCAIVASNTRPLHEAIEHNRTGRLVDFFDIPGLVEEVSALLNMPEARQRLGANAREFAVRHYDLNSVCLPRQLKWVDDLAVLGKN